MKQLILFSLISLALSTSGQGTYNGDAKFFNKDIDSILINLQNKGFSTIDIQITTKYKGGGMDVHHLFKRIDDKRISDERKYCTNGESHLDYYYCKNNKVKFLESEDDVKIRNGAETKGFPFPKLYSKEKDSAGYTLVYRYTILKKDTIFGGCDRTKKDANGNLVYALHYFDKFKTPVSEEDYFYSADTLEYFTAWSFIKGEKKFQMSDSTHSQKIISGNTRTITSIRKSSLASESKIIHSSSSSVRIIHFDTYGIIEEENYNDTDSYGNNVRGVMKVTYKK